jgi:hypothetical protein
LRDDVYSYFVETVETIEKEWLPKNN